jgi:hypothetical protein
MEGREEEGQWKYSRPQNDITNEEILTFRQGIVKHSVFI